MTWETDLGLVPGDDEFNRNLIEQGLRVADAFEVEGIGDPSAITWRAEEARLEAAYQGRWS